MSNSEVVRALRRRISFYLNAPVFNKYSQSIIGFLAVTGMIIGALLLILFVLVLFIEDSGDMTGIGNCGTPDCIDQ